MDWQAQLRDIVDKARQVPTFEEWLTTTGYGEIPGTLTNPLQMRSLMKTLYLRYRSEFG